MSNEARISNDEDDCESAEYYVCMKAAAVQYFEDDKYDFCCKCGEKVRYRPHGPVAPQKICLECAMPDMIKAKASGDLEVVTSQKCADDFKARTGKTLAIKDTLDKI